MRAATALSLPDQIVQSWRTHNQVSLLLIDAIPQAGWTAVPTGSRGRDVARVFLHLHKVRAGWVYYHATGKRPQSEGRISKTDPPPPAAALRSECVETGLLVEDHLKQCLAGEARVRMFGGSPVRWMSYLIAHESHHRGQIALALKQNGMRLPDKIGLEGLWGKWMSAKG